MIHPLQHQCFITMSNSFLPAPRTEHGTHSPHPSCTVFSKSSFILPFLLPPAFPYNFYRRLASHINSPFQFISSPSSPRRHYRIRDTFRSTSTILPTTLVRPHLNSVYFIDDTSTHHSRCSFPFPSYLYWRCPKAPKLLSFTSPMTKRPI